MNGYRLTLLRVIWSAIRLGMKMPFAWAKDAIRLGVLTAIQLSCRNQTQTNRYMVKKLLFRLDIGWAK
jgi:hypothetical protein